MSAERDDDAALMAEGYRELAHEMSAWACISRAAQFAVLNENEIWGIEDGKA